MAAALEHPPGGWSFDEAAHAGAEHHDADYAASYDAKAQADPSSDLEQLIELGLDATSTLVDLGAGTGTFALAAAGICAQVVAVDVSPAMLAVAEREATRRSLHNVTFVDAGFLTYEHAGPPADAAHSRNALHHLPISGR